MSPEQSIFGDTNGLSCGDEEGSLTFSARRTMSERMKRILQRLGKEGGIPEVVAFVTSRRGLSHESASGSPCLWFHWKGVTFAEERFTRDLREGERMPVLVLSATETGHENGREPRQVKLTLTMQKLPKQ